MINIKIKILILIFSVYSNRQILADENEYATVQSKEFFYGPQNYGINMVYFECALFIFMHE
jgi:hypothetical protein